MVSDGTYDHGFGGHRLTEGLSGCLFQPRPESEDAACRLVTSGTPRFVSAGKPIHLKTR